MVSAGRWVLGLMFGFVGALIGGYIFGVSAEATVSYLIENIKYLSVPGLRVLIRQGGKPFVALMLISGVIPGIMFGLPTRGGNRGIRALIGAGVGFLCILFGYYSHSEKCLQITSSKHQNPNNIKYQNSNVQNTSFCFARTFKNTFKRRFVLNFEIRIWDLFVI